MPGNLVSLQGAKTTRPARAGNKRRNRKVRPSRGGVNWTIAKSNQTSSRWRRGFLLASRNQTHWGWNDERTKAAHV